MLTGSLSKIEEPLKPGNLKKETEMKTKGHNIISMLKSQRKEMPTINVTDEVD